MISTFTAGGLFSGVGCFDLAFERAGFNVAYQVENDAKCQRVLEAHWPGVKRFGDIRDVKTFPQTDVIFGGFPCQDLSRAGRRRGIDGARSGLWREFMRAVGEIRPSFAVFENVPELALSGLDRILCALAEIGYDAEWCSLSACQFGFNHRRERLFVVAHPAQFGRPIQRLRNELSGGRKAPGGFEEAHGADPDIQRFSQSPVAVGPERRDGVAGIFPFEKPIRARRVEPGGVSPIVGGRLNPRYVEWMMGVPDGWTDCGLSNRQRIERLGNGVVVDVGEFAASVVMNALKKNDGQIAKFA